MGCFIDSDDCEPPYCAAPPAAAYWAADMPCVLPPNCAAVIAVDLDDPDENDIDA